MIPRANTCFSCGSEFSTADAARRCCQGMPTETNNCLCKKCGHAWASFEGLECSRCIPPNCTREHCAGYVVKIGNDARCTRCGDRYAADMVNHPPHYTFGTIEVIDVIEGLGLGFCAGNAVKYIARADHKGTREQDLKKAIWYIERMLKE